MLSTDAASATATALTRTSHAIMYDIHTTPTSTDSTTATSTVSVNGPDDIRDGDNGRIHLLIW